MSADAVAQPGLLRRVGVFLELGKFKIVELWLGFFVGVSLLGPRAIADGRSVAILALILLAGVCVIAATCSLDDIVGVRDGVDQANHTEGKRWGVAKPILSGELAEASAFRFVHLLGVVGALAYAFALALAWPLPAWLIATLTAMMLVAVNYSYGLKLSYHGAGELVIFLGGVGTVLAPYALVAKAWTPTLLALAGLVGAWHAQVVMFSNTKDAAGDRATGRMTIAARTSPRGNAIFIASAFTVVWLATFAAFAAHALEARHALALAPVWALQAYQLFTGVARREWLEARLLGFRALRLGIIALTVANFTRWP